jgi:hypothetical protein
VGKLLLSGGTRKLIVFTVGKLFFSGGTKGLPVFTVEKNYCYLVVSEALCHQCGKLLLSGAKRKLLAITVRKLLLSMSTCHNCQKLIAIQVVIESSHAILDKIY